MKLGTLGIWVVGCAIAASVHGCSDTHPTPAPGDRNTNWLKPCTAPSQCGGGLDCIADVCTRACDSIADCTDPELALTCAAGVCVKSTSMPMAGSSSPAPDASMPMADGATPTPKPDAGDPTCGSEEPTRKPGPNLYDKAAVGPGSCSGTTLGSVIAAIHAAHPDLADITYLIDPASPPPPIAIDAQITAFEREDGFAIVLQRGAGDCESGCIGREYWYFRTDASCTPQQVGHYKPHRYDATCNLEGYPMWDTPIPPADYPSGCGPSLFVWGAVHVATPKGCGKSMACAPSGAAKDGDDVMRQVVVEIRREEADPSAGTITLQGTGYELLDHRPLAATIQGTIVRANVTETLPSTCLEQFTLEFQLDLDANQESYLRYEEARTPNCTGGGELCKGSLQLDFGRYGRADSCSFVGQDISRAIDWARSPHLACENDDDCTVVGVETDCLHGCAVAVRADFVAQLQQAIDEAGAAFCPDASGCTMVSQDCMEANPVCRAGLCEISSP